MARIPYPNNLSQAVKDKLLKLGGLNVTRMMAHSDPVLDGYSKLGLALLRKGKLDPRLREIAVLKIGLLCGSDYEWHQHVTFARAVGVQDGTIDAVAADQRDKLSHLERTVVEFAEETFLHRRVSDKVFETIAEHLSHEEIVELSLACGYYVMTAGFLMTFDIEIENGPSLGETISKSQSRQT